MPQKKVIIPEIGEVVIVKRRRAKNLRLTIRPDGRVRVGLPHWAPYSAAINFVSNRTDWIIKNQDRYSVAPLRSGHTVGKNHKMLLVTEPGRQKVSTRVTENHVIIRSGQSAQQQDIQRLAAKAAERALKKQAESLLPERLRQIAGQHELSYKELKIKRMVSRWGSCSEQGTVTINYYLIQLPWNLIDYVLAHELAHTAHLNHSAEFWQLLETIIPDAKHLRKEIRNYRPALVPL